MSAEEKRELVKSLRRVVREVHAKAAEALTILEALGTGETPKRELDDKGEPTWAYRVRVAIPQDIHLTARMSKYAYESGVKLPSEALAMFSEFTEHYRRTGKKWKDWYLVWCKWVREDAKRKNGAPQGYVSRFDRAESVARK